MNEFLTLKNKPYFDPEINKNMRQSVGLPATQCLPLTNHIPPCIANLTFTLRFVMSSLFTYITITIHNCNYDATMYIEIRLILR